MRCSHPDKSDVSICEVFICKVVKSKLSFGRFSYALGMSAMPMAVTIIFSMPLELRRTDTFERDFFSCAVLICLSITYKIDTCNAEEEELFDGQPHRWTLKFQADSCPLNNRYPSALHESRRAKVKMNMQMRSMQYAIVLISALMASVCTTQKRNPSRLLNLSRHPFKNLRCM